MSLLSNFFTYMLRPRERTFVKDIHLNEVSIPVLAYSGLVCFGSDVYCQKTSQQATKELNMDIATATFMISRSSIGPMSPDK